MAPLVSVIIVNHNGIEFVEACLRSVFASLYQNIEIIFVDNGSSDGSLEYVREAFGNQKQLRIIENSASLGPAVGRNRGAKVSRGAYLAFLDNDTKVQPNWLSELIKVFEQDASIGAAQSKLLRMETNFYDCAGDYLGPLGFLIERSRGAEDKGQFDYIADILNAKSASSIIRKDIFDKVGGFDEDFYMYLEETDLSWRVWLAGYRVVFVPSSVVYHAYRTPKKEMHRYYSKYIVRYYGCRNYLTTSIKNLALVNLFRILPLQVGCLFFLSLFFLYRGLPEDSFYVLKAIGWNLLNLDSVLRKRQIINSCIRKVGDAKFLPKVSDQKSLVYYFGKATSYITGRPF